MFVEFEEKLESFPIEDLCAAPWNERMPEFVCKCGTEWKANPLLEGDGPIACPGCGEIVDVEIEGIGDLREDQLGKELGKYSWCGNCLALTLNVSGTTYGGKPMSGHKAGGWINRKGNPVTVTDENMADLFFACAECPAEKFWAGWYQCPRCDADGHYFVTATDPVSSRAAAMEYGGNPMDWDEQWKCGKCGQLYWISNANY